MDTKIAAKKAWALASVESIPFGKSEFSTYSPIYIATTSNVRNTLHLYHDYEQVLSVCGTGAHAYEALLHGAKHVDLFDINELQRIYFLYMKTAIMVLSYDEFIRYFTTGEGVNGFDFEPLIEDLLANDLFYKLEPYLPDEVREVFGPIFDQILSENVLFSKLFRYGHNFSLSYLREAASFYRREEYERLQQILRKNPDVITTRTMSLTEVPLQFHSQYDLVLLDNILEYYGAIPNLNTPRKVDSFVKQDMSSLLSNGGSMQVAYAYAFDTETFCDAFDLPIVNDSELDDVFNPVSDAFFAALTTSFLEMDLESATRVLADENLMIPLVRDMDGYQYSIFDGINESDGKNMVLTYTKRKS